MVRTEGERRSETEILKAECGRRVIRRVLHSPARSGGRCLLSTLSITESGPSQQLERSHICTDTYSECYLDTSKQERRKGADEADGRPFLRSGPISLLETG